MIVETFLLALTTVFLTVLYGLYSLLASCLSNERIAEKLVDAGCEVAKTAYKANVNNQQQNQQPKKHCKSCNSSKHFTHECYQACGNCGEMGHDAHQCPNPKERKNAPSFVNAHYRSNNHH